MQFAGYGYGYLAGSLVDSLEAAITIAPMIISPFMVFGGFLSNPDSMPSGFAWIRFLSVIST